MKYLRADKLQIADVLLVKSPGKASGIIARSTGSVYSHAAIYADHLRLCEALTDGVGYTELELVKVELHDGWNHQFCDISAYERVDIFRLPESARPRGFGTNEFRERFSELLWEYNGVDYSTLERLAKASPLGRAMPTLSWMLMRAIGVLMLGDARKQLPGPFCSELVSLVLDRAGFELFSEGRSPHTTAPGDLLRGTLLQPLTDFFDVPSPAIPDNVEGKRMLTMHPWIDSKFVGHLKKQEKQIAELVGAHRFHSGSKTVDQ